MWLAKFLLNVLLKKKSSEGMIIWHQIKYCPAWTLPCLPSSVFFICFINYISWYYKYYLTGWYCYNEWDIENVLSKLLSKEGDKSISLFLRSYFSTMAQWCCILLHQTDELFLQGVVKRWKNITMCVLMSSLRKRRYLRLTLLRGMFHRLHKLWIQSTATWISAFLSLLELCTQLVGRTWC